MQRPYHFTCLLRNLIQVKKQDLEPDMVPQIGSKFGKEYVKAKYYHTACFNLHAGYIMRNPGLDESQAEIKIASRNINNLRYADDTTLMADGEGNGTPLQYSCLENPMDGGAW